MTGFVFLFRKKGLYNIGHTENLDKKKQILLPDEIIAILKTDSPEKITKRLHADFKELRLPESDYFLFNDTQRDLCQQKLVDRGGEKSPKPFFSGYKLFLSFLIAWIGISGLIISLLIQPILNKLS